MALREELLGQQYLAGSIQYWFTVSKTLLKSLEEFVEFFVFKMKSVPDIASEHLEEYFPLSEKKTNLDLLTSRLQIWKRYSSDTTHFHIIDDAHEFFQKS